MSSFSAPIVTRTPFQASSFFTSSSKKSHLPSPSFSCKPTNDYDHDQNPSSRRDVLLSLGVGGLYCATSLIIEPLFYVAYNKPFMKVARAETKNPSTPIKSFPLVLDKAICTMVSRPKKSRSSKEKEEEEEVLVIEGIVLERDVVVKFDVFVNDEDNDSSSHSGPDKTEFAGSFVNVPHHHQQGKKKMNTCLRLGITDLLEDLGVEDDDSVLVSLVPRYGAGLVTVGAINIEFLQD